MKHKWEPESCRDLPYTPIMDRPTTYNKTGVWRTYRPIVDKEKCTDCYICWKFCPDVSILIQEDGSIEIDYDHCKGCGICAEVCPVKAIEMERER